MNAANLQHNSKFWCFFAVFLFLSACQGPLYNVAPIPQASPIESGKSASTNVIEVTAAALLDDDKVFERFDANLVLAGIIVVDVNVVNRSSELLHLKFELRDAEGRNFSQLDSKKSLDRVMKFEGIRAYSKLGKQETLEQLEAVAISKKLILPVQQQKRGVLFFNAKRDVAQLRDLRLTVKGIKEPIQIFLN
jgi:hypothetical protein